MKSSFVEDKSYIVPTIGIRKNKRYFFFTKVLITKNKKIKTMYLYYFHGTLNCE